MNGCTYNAGGEYACLSPAASASAPASAESFFPEGGVDLIPMKNAWTSIPATEGFRGGHGGGGVALPTPPVKTCHVVDGRSVCS